VGLTNYELVLNIAFHMEVKIATTSPYFFHVGVPRRTFATIAIAAQIFSRLRIRS
jgi:hypothetical protein